MSNAEVIDFPPKLYAPRKLDIACGQNKTKGFKGIDQSGDADITHNLLEFPWPIKSNSVREVVCNHFVEHIPHYNPYGEPWEFDGFFMFFREIFRICAHDAQVEINHPYVWNSRAFWDPTHVRFIHWMTYKYLEPEWREANGLEHYIPEVNFEVLVNDAPIAGDIASRAPEFQTFASEHYINTWGDLHVILKVVKK